MPTQLDHSTLRPPAPQLRGRYILLAVLVHVVLIIAISFNITWRSETPPPARAELWSESQLVSTVKPPQQQKTQPTPQKTIQPDPIQEPMGQHADIALKQKRLEEERLAAQKAKEQERIAAEKARQIEAQRQEEERLAIEKAKKEEEKRKEQERIAAEKAKQEAQKIAAAEKARKDAAEKARLEKLRQDQLARIQGMAGGNGNSNTGATGPVGGSGRASAGYTARLAGIVKRNIVYPGDRNQNIVTEVFVATDNQGNIKRDSIKITKSSGNPQWDDAVIKALQKTGQLPADVGGKRPETEFNFVFSPKD